MLITWTGLVVKHIVLTYSFYATPHIPFKRVNSAELGKVQSLQVILGGSEI